MKPTTLLNDTQFELASFRMANCFIKQQSNQAHLTPAAQMVAQLRTSDPNCHFNCTSLYQFNPENVTPTPHLLTTSTNPFATPNTISRNSLVDQRNTTNHENAAYDHVPIRKRIRSDTYNDPGRNPVENLLEYTSGCISAMPSAEQYFEENPLIAPTLKPSAQSKYISAYEKFRKTDMFASQDIITLDDQLSAYIHRRFHENASAGTRQEMANLICMLLVMHPNLKTHLGLSTRCLSGWKAIKPSQSATPLSKDMVHAFAWYLINSNRPQSALVAMITYVACLRVSEALNVSWSDVPFPGDVRLRSHGPQVAGLNIADAKTTRKTGRLQFVALPDQLCIKLLRIYQVELSTDGKIVNLSYSKYLRDLKDAATSFGLYNSRCTTHSSRIGKATDDYIKGLNVDQIAINGRWKSLNSLRYYLDNGKSWLLNISINERQQQQISAASSSMKTLVHHA